MSGNNIGTVRQHLLDQMQALRDAKPEEVQRELERARGIGELAQVAVNSAKVEVDYLKLTDQMTTPFLEAQGSLPAGVTGITRHTLGR